jgi:hypothetical protein
VSTFTPLALACVMIASAALVYSFIVAAVRFATLPERIPCHFTIMGTPDAWSGKRIIWLFPAVSLVLIVGMAITAYEGDILRLPAEEIPPNVEKMAVCAAFTSILFLLLINRTIAVAEKRAQGLGRFFCLGVLAGLVIMILLIER